MMSALRTRRGTRGRSRGRDTKAVCRVVTEDLEQFYNV